MNIERNKTNCHSKLDLESSTQVVYQQQRQASKILNQVQDDLLVKHHGFTLIELLIVVLIIGVLVAIAVPQYQKAVLKSRFSSLMPTAQAIRDGNEMYYMTNGGYADALAKLDVTTANTEDMTITLSDDSDYAYTLATRPSLKNNLIMYQKHSLNFPGEIHCEALQGNKLANWVCETGMHAVKALGEVVTPGYNTYVLEGTGNGLTPAQQALAELMANVSCDKATAMGYTCEITDKEEGTKKKRICSDTGVCSVYDYNLDGSYKRTTCKVNGNKCDTKYEHVYNANGNEISQRFCRYVQTDGSCSVYETYDNYDYVYDTNGNQTVKRYCQTIATDGTCSSYMSNGFNYTYDANGNMISKRQCSQVATDGTCSAYSNSSNTDYTYDANGNRIYSNDCSAIKSDGTCTTYTNSYNYMYDTNGNMTSSHQCKTVLSDGRCSEYTTDSNYNIYYTYDTNGNKISERHCKTVSADGSCSAYSNSSAMDYTYDASGNQTAARTCQTVAEDGTCSTYSRYATYFKYDANGNKTSQWGCSSVSADGTCSAYSSAIKYTYDDEGNTTSRATCQTWNAAKTQCAVWSTPSFYY